MSHAWPHAKLGLHLGLWTWIPKSKVSSLVALKFWNLFGKWELCILFWPAYHFYQMRRRFWESPETTPSPYGLGVLWTRDWTLLGSPCLHTHLSPSWTSFLSSFLPPSFNPPLPPHPTPDTLPCLDLQLQVQKFELIICCNSWYSSISSPCTAHLLLIIIYSLLSTYPFAILHPFPTINKDSSKRIFCS